VARTGFTTLLYHNADVAFALQLATDLRNRGVNLFLDRLDIRPQDDWNATHTSAVLNCAVLIVVLSPAFVTSPFARSAMTRVAELKRPILPVVLRPLSSVDYPTQVDYRRFISMVGWHDSQVYNSGLNTLFTALQQTRTVAISRTVDPEVRYVNSLNMLIELYKANLEPPVAPDEVDELSLTPPRPRLEAAWGTGGVLLARGVTMQEAAPIDRLSRYAAQNPRFAVIGANGIGKTTVLLRLMQEHVRAYLENPRYTPVPMYADLSYWSPHEDIHTFLAQQAKPISDPTADIAKGRVAVYLDGLSDLGIHEEVKIGKLREWLNSRKPPQRVVLACDSSLYSRRFGFDLPVVSLEPLTDTQVRDQQSAMMGRQAHAFSQRLLAHPQGVRWMRNTLMLRNAMYFVSMRDHAELPPNAERLIVRVVEAQWTQEQINDNPDWMLFNEMIVHLAEFAFRLMTSGQPYSATPEQAVQWLGSESLLHALASARILQVMQRRVKFWHRSVLNVFAALHLKNQNVDEYLAYTQFDESGRRVSHHWDAVLVALAGVLDDPEPLLLHLSEVDPYLALEAMITRDIRAEVRDTVYEQFMRYALTHDTAQYPATFNLLENATLGRTIPQVLALMREGRWPLRELAHHFLLRLQYPVADDLKVIQQWDGTVQEDLATYFANIGEEAIPPLLHLLRSPLPQARAGAVWALHVLKDRAALPGLALALADEDARVRQAAAQALRDLPDAAVVKPLVVRLGDEDWRVRKAVTEAILTLGAAAVPPLRRLLKAPEPMLQRIAIGVLGRLGDQSVVPDLLPFADDENPDLRAISVIALGQLAHPDAVEVLRNRAEDTVIPRWGKLPIAQLARQALELIGTEDAMKSITELFGRRASTASKSSDVVKDRIKSDRARHPVPSAPFAEEIVPLPAPAAEKPPEDLAVLQPPPLLEPPVLSPNLDDTVDELEAILRTLQIAHSRQRDRAAMRLIELARKNHRRYNPSMVRRLEAGLYDEDAYIRENTVEALGHLADPSLASALVASTLHDASWTIRMATMRALAEMGDASVIPHILPLLKDDRAAVREVAAEVLGQFARPEALPGLQEALKDESPFVRYTAVRSIAHIGDAAAVPAVLALLESDDNELKLQAIKALGIISTPSAEITAEVIKRLGEYVGNTYESPFYQGLTLGVVAERALEQIGTPAALWTLVKRSSRTSQQGE
jgi:HEAT repeat protein